MTIGRELTQEELLEVTGGGKSVKRILQEIGMELGLKAIQVTMDKVLEALSERKRTTSSTPSSATTPIMGSVRR